MFLFSFASAGGAFVAGAWGALQIAQVTANEYVETLCTPSRIELINCGPENYCKSGVGDSCRSCKVWVTSNISGVPYFEDEHVAVLEKMDCLCGSCQAHVKAQPAGFCTESCYAVKNDDHVEGLSLTDGTMELFTGGIVFFAGSFFGCVGAWFGIHLFGQFRKAFTLFCDNSSARVTRIENF